MNKVVIYKGSKKGFADFLKKTERVSTYSLLISEMYRLDSLRLSGVNFILHDQTSDEKVSKMQSQASKLLDVNQKIENLIVFSEDYSGLNEHVFYNFPLHLEKLNVDNLYVHNPPVFFEKVLRMAYEPKDIISDTNETYQILDTNKLREFEKKATSRIIGQKSALEEILITLTYSLMNKFNKPIILLLYGDTGVGKTESVKILGEVMGGRIFRKQMSMFQSHESTQYLFGGRHNEKSFAKDLVARETNIILLDEFDKVSPIYHNAFYQFFDEGIYEDINYKADVEGSIIICTSNFKDISEIKKVLGEPIFSRFDAVIEFTKLSIETLKQIIQSQIEIEFNNLSSKQKKLVDKKEIEVTFNTLSENEVACFSNARIAKNYVQYSFANYLRRKLILPNP